MNYPFYTYEEGRHCKHCFEPLTDQVHKNREFCQNEIQEDGSVKSCHDDYHTKRKQVTQAPFRVQTAFQKRMATALSHLHQAFGGEASLAQLNLYGIQLPNALEITPKGGNLYQFRFTGFLIEQLTFSQFKIHTHVPAL